MFQNEPWPEAKLCNVHDTLSLEKLQPLLRRWKIMLAGDDPHSVEQQMLTLAWDNAVYRCYNESLRIADRAKIDTASTLADFIHRAFFAKQVMSIRRLLDYRRKKPGWEVYSIRTINSELKEHIDLFTRENYVCYDGTIYEASDHSNDWRQKLISDGRHLVFDTLSVAHGRTRSRNDSIAIELLNNMEVYLNKDELLRKYANKYLAHAAAPPTRQFFDPELSRITLNYIQRMYRILIWACKLLGKITDQLVLTEVAVPDYDQFTGWTNAILSDHSKSMMTKYWKKRANYFTKWSSVYWSPEVLYRSPYKT